MQGSAQPVNDRRDNDRQDDRPDRGRSFEESELDSALQLLVERAQYITGATGTALAQPKLAHHPASSPADRCLAGDIPAAIEQIEACARNHSSWKLKPKLKPKFKPKSKPVQPECLLRDT